MLIEFICKLLIKLKTITNGVFALLRSSTSGIPEQLITFILL